MSARKLELFAVQMHISVADYASADVFVQRMSSLFERLDALRIRDRRGGYKHPALAVFPEDIGTFLFMSPYYRLVRSARTIEDALRRIALVRLPKVFWLRARHRTTVLRSLVMMTARRSYELYHRTFSCLARRYQVAVVAGSLLVPDNRYGATGTFRLTRSRAGVYNLSVTFDARGEVLHTTRKVNVLPGFEDMLGVDPGPVEEQRPFEVQGTRVGNILCVDGWTAGSDGGEVPVGERLVRAGAEILVQPSATTLPWAAPDSLRDTIPDAVHPGVPTHGEACFTQSLLALMKAHPSVLFGVNPMLNGTFLDRRFEGRSTIIGRSAQGAPRILCAASSYGDASGSEQILHHVANLPPRPRLEPPAGVEKLAIGRDRPW